MCLICLRFFVSAQSIENKPLAHYNTLALLRAAQRPMLHRGINNLSCSPSNGEEWISTSFTCLLYEKAVNMECFPKWRSWELDLGSFASPLVQSIRPAGLGYTVPFCISWSLQPIIPEWAVSVQHGNKETLPFCVTSPPSPRCSTASVLTPCSLKLLQEMLKLRNRWRRLRCLLLSVRKVQCYSAFLSLGIVCYSLVNISQW